MCHDAFANVEMCQIANEPGLELDAMNLCLCPNCAREYKRMRSDSDKVEWFLNSIAELEDSDINGVDPVEIDFDGEPIWFTQSHVAEIRELMALQDEAENYSENSSKKSRACLKNHSCNLHAPFCGTFVSNSVVVARYDALIRNKSPTNCDAHLAESIFQTRSSTRSNREDTVTSEDEPVNAGTDVYKEYVGKRIYHKGHKAHGTVISCDGTYLEVQFEDGNRAGQNVRFSLQMCIEKGLLQLV